MSVFQALPTAASSSKALDSTIMHNVRCCARGLVSASRSRHQHLLAQACLVGWVEARDVPTADLQLQAEYVLVEELNEKLKLAGLARVERIS